VPELFDHFYRQTTAAESHLLGRGQLCWGPIQYLAQRLATLQLVYYDPRDERNNTYQITPNQTLDQAFNHTPVHDLNLHSDEEMLMVKAKLRPMAVISQKPTEWTLAGGRLNEKGYICVPLYSFHQDESQEFRNRVWAVEYPSWVYLPGDTRLGMKEGFARLDRVQVLDKELISPTQVALSEDALWWLSEWLRYYLTEEIEPLFMEERQERLGNI